jgi:hypothetical protein
VVVVAEILLANEISRFSISLVSNNPFLQIFPNISSWTLNHTCSQAPVFQESKTISTFGDYPSAQIPSLHNCGTRLVPANCPSSHREGLYIQR